MTEENNIVANKAKRPLSPHLQVYKLPMTAKMSISHRITGVLLTVGLVLLSIWVIAAGMGEEAYNTLMSLIDTPLTKFVFMGWAFVLFYHMGNGFRHLFWDLGIGITEKSAMKTGTLVILFAVGMTALIWWLTCDCATASDAGNAVEGVLNETE